MIVPVTLLGYLSSLASQDLGDASGTSIAISLSRVPLAFLWVYLNVLIFSIANQRLPPSVLEDKLNKPWRPLPAGLISPSEARYLLLFFIPAVYAICGLFLGATHEFLLCTGGAWLYNDLGGADEHFVLRNLLNSIAYFVYGSGATRVAMGRGEPPHSVRTYAWLAMIAAVIFTTMQVQDLKDQEGDRARNRSTAPLKVGDRQTRWSIVVGVLAWSIICPTYWNSSAEGYGIPLCLGLVVAVRVLLKQGREEDRHTYMIWSWWLMSLFPLPLLSGFVCNLRSLWYSQS